jgi:hypothetical protein
MADVAGPVSCAACGRPLPPQQGRGRKRIYCHARCRDAARRRRARTAGPDLDIVKATLTSLSRHEYLDASTAAPALRDAVHERVRSTADRLLAEASHGGGEPLAAVAAARELAAASDTALQQAVDQARAAGHSWREVGEVLGTTRQAAFQRFGRPIDPRSGLTMSRSAPPDAADRAVAIFGWHDEGRYAEIIEQLDETMRGLHSPELLARGWATMASLYGRLERIGAPFPRPGSGDAVIIVPLFFAAGEARGIVRFGADGRVAAMAIRPAVT